MKPKIVRDLDSYQAEAQDFVDRVISSFRELKGAAERKAFENFWCSYLPSGTSTLKNEIPEASIKIAASTDDDSMHLPDVHEIFRNSLGNSIAGAAALKDACWNAYLFLFTLCYLPGIQRPSPAQNFPSPCGYEILIPYRQQKQSSVIVYIVPKDTMAGDTAVAMVMEVLPHPSRSSWLRAALNDMTFSSTTDHVPTRHYSFLRRFTSATFVHKDALLRDNVLPSSGPTVITLRNEPLLRLPCYSVPHQIIYEMGSAEIGDFWVPADYTARELFADLLKKAPHDSEIVLQRRVLSKKDAAIIHALHLWSNWQGLRIENDDQWKHLEQVFSYIGSHLYAKSETAVRTADHLRKDCTRLIADHAKTTYPRKVRRFQD